MANIEARAQLTHEEAFSRQGCGAGTEGACFGLSLEAGGMICSIAAQDSAAMNMSGIFTGWRMNMDLEDGRPWCPKGIFGGSKVGDYSTPIFLRDQNNEDSTLPPAAE